MPEINWYINTTYFAIHDYIGILYIAFLNIQCIKMYVMLLYLYCILAYKYLPARSAKGKENDRTVKMIYNSN